jgi:hypothetical protein
MLRCAQHDKAGSALQSMSGESGSDLGFFRTTGQV